MDPNANNVLVREITNYMKMVAFNAITHNNSNYNANLGTSTNPIMLLLCNLIIMQALHLLSL
jgi:hypothetical protein